MKPDKLIITTSDSTKPLPSAQEIAWNTDLITEILFRLPIKSLVRFKSVSKQWLSLISDPKFPLRQRIFPSGLFLQHSPSDEFDFVNLNPNPSRPPFQSLAFGDDTNGIRIAQSCNGLLLCYYVYDTDETTSKYYVYNPTTKHYMVLPHPFHTRHDDITIHGITLAFDPSISSHYKAICVRNYNYDQTEFEIDIYSSETGVWRQSSLGFFNAVMDTNFMGGVFWNGCVYWTNPWDPFLYFDVEDERIHRLTMPPLPDGVEVLYRDFAYLGTFRDHLHFVNGYHRPGEERFKVYEMERDHSRWFVKYIVDISQVYKAFPDMFGVSDTDRSSNGQLALRLFILCVVHCANEEDSFLVMKVPGKVLRYNFKDGTFCKLVDVPIKNGRDWFFQHTEAFQYIESLTSL